MASASIKILQNTAIRLKNLFDLDRLREFERDALALCCFGASVFFWISLFSFQPTDSWIFSLNSSAAATRNICGSFGNSLAGFTVFYFGMAAFAMPLIGIQLALLIRKSLIKESLAPVFFGWAGLTFALMPLLNQIRPFFAIRGISFATGGALGQVTQMTLEQTLGPIGSQITLWTVLLAALILTTHLGFIDVWQFVKKTTSSAKDFHKADVNQQKVSPLQGEVSHSNSPSLLSLRSDVLTQTTMVEPQPEEKSTPELFDTFKRTLHFISKPEDSEKSVAETNSPILNSEDTKLHLSLDDEDQDFAAKVPYVAPSLQIFKRTDERIPTGLSQKELEATSLVLVKTLEEFGVTGKIVGWQPGPVVTVYEYQPDAGVKQSKILGLLDDLALSLKVDSIFIHPISGKRALGIQVPNSRREPVLLGDVLDSEIFNKSPSPLTFAMGKTINGTPFCADVTAMPHLLAAGATGTGKSVAINSLLCSIIMKSSPDDVRMILVDPKMLELSVYDGIPHLLMPVITEPDRASIALKWAANEMERRYKLMQHAQVRNIGGFNSFWDQATDERKTQLRGLMGDDSIERLPYILLVIDELADLMLTAPKDVESSIQRLAQKARASGIHMVLATQRPSVDVITGVIKANLPCRLSFQVVSKHDSRTILDQVGSEKLLGKGDILLQRPGIGKLERLQGALVTDEEVLSLVASAKTNYKSTYDERAMGWIDEEVTRSLAAENAADDLVQLADQDPKWDEAINIAKTHGVVSASFLQRHLKIGYNRAARIVETMEAQGLVARADGSKPRRWLGSNA
jgi:DNA segregation ATPase FtsK/SpoIIIE, S-DNA-T family